MPRTPMLSEAQIIAWRDDLTSSLEMWREPDGILLPTEPDPKERAECRQNLRVAIEILTRVLAG